jgi:phospholipid/cholesterol/gamma-HCH transport system substrate-binding protein
MKLIFSNSNEYYEPGDTLLSGIDKGLSGVMDLLIKKAEVMLTSLDTSINSVNRVFDDSTRENLRKAIEDFGSVANSLHQSLGENGDINESMKNLKSVSQNLKNNNEQLSNIIHNVSSLSDSLSKTEIKTMIANANHSLINADSILASIKNGEGSLGLLVNNDTLYYNLKNASECLNQLLKDLYAHPKRYVHFSIFGKKDKVNKK